MGDVVGALAARLLDCLCAQLALSPGGPVCACCLSHSGVGAPADECDCPCPDGESVGQGQAWVRVAAVVATPTVNRGSGCTHGRWSPTYELGSRRCVSVVDGAGNAPSCQTRTDEAVLLAGDAAAHRAVVRCCEALKDIDITVVNQLPDGPAGGCAGWLTLVTVGPLRECGCPKPPDPPEPPPGP